MEDALTSFVSTGKLDFRGLVNSMIADLARFAARAAMAPVFGALGSALGLGAAGAGGFSSSSLLGGMAGGLSDMFGAGGGNAYGFHLATGGRVTGPGTSTSDSIPAWLSNEEFVVKAAAVRKPGVLRLLEAINSGQDLGFAKFATAGSLAVVRPAVACSAPRVSVELNIPVTIDGGTGNAAQMMASAEFVKSSRRWCRADRGRKSSGWRALETEEWDGVMTDTFNWSPTVEGSVAIRRCVCERLVSAMGTRARPTA
jgi:hypothetical protein